MPIPNSEDEHLPPNGVLGYNLKISLPKNVDVKLAHSLLIDEHIIELDDFTGSKTNYNKKCVEWVSQSNAGLLQNYDKMHFNEVIWRLTGYKHRGAVTERT